MLLRPGQAEALARFFADLAASGDDAFFHPHPGDVATLQSIAEHPGKDIHAVFIEGEDVRVYGLLRGWNEGFAIPSLGIAVHPAVRAVGLGSLMMEYLETMARYRGANAIRLRVHKGNALATAIYERRGYAMSPDDDPRLLLGFKSLGASA